MYSNHPVCQTPDSKSCKEGSGKKGKKDQDVEEEEGISGDGFG
jgi:hypothetical protein